LTHKLLHKNGAKNICKACNMKFKTSDHLKRHMQKVHKRNISSCSLNTESSESNYECKICNKQFQNDNNLSVHMNIHFPKGLKQHVPTQKLNLACQSCSGRFTNHDDLNYHVAEVHGGVNNESTYLLMK